jgi:hypothetical protein
MKKYIKEFEDGKEVYKTLDGFGRPGRKVDTMEWDIHQYINYCLFPLQNCINRMREANEFESETGQFVEILGRLYEAADVQLEKMEEAIYKDMGWIKIATTNESCFGDFLQQDFLEVYVEKEEAKPDHHTDAQRHPGLAGVLTVQKGGLKWLASQKDAVGTS